MRLERVPTLLGYALMVPYDKVSIIIVGRDVAPFVRTALISAIGQRYPNFEIIFVDDHSSDETPEIVERCSFPGIQIVRNSSHLGQAASRNKALRYASGKWIANLDGDDYMTPSRIASQVRFARRLNSPTILGAWARKFGASQGLIAPPFTVEGCKVRSLFSSPVVHSSMFTSRSLLGELRYNTDFIQVADYELVSRALEKGIRVLNIPKALVGYRVHQRQISALYPERGKKLMEKIQLRALEKLGISASRSELNLHIALSTGQWSSEIQQVNNVEFWSWSMKLLQASAASNAYRTAPLVTELLKRRIRLARER